MNLKWCAIILSIGVAVGCDDEPYDFDAADPGRGPADLLGARNPLNETYGAGYSDNATPADVTPPQENQLPPCDESCRDYCQGLELQNPMDRAVCRGLWGLGLTTQPINRDEACRRLHADLLGVLPSKGEVDKTCGDRAYDDIVAELIADPRFVLNQQRHWADSLRYNNEAVSVERIYDADRLVGMLYEGRIAYDEFVAFISAHPVLTRRYDNAPDTVAALFELFLGRPPFDNERSDMARLYTLWGNGYYDHPTLGMRLPDAVVQFACLNENGEVDEERKGECTSILWGYKELILTPDYRTDVTRNGGQEMWSGLLSADEWSKLQEPGRIIASQRGFWEYAAQSLLERYLGYDIATPVPEVLDALGTYLIEHNGDMRALHFAIATSQLYLQSNSGSTPTAHRHTYGPLKQVQVETWIDSVKATTGYDLSQCDHRIPDPGRILDAQTVAALDLVDASRWHLEDDGVREDYRDLARTLGGCPDNSVGGRFKTVSILTTATQEGFVARVCNPANEPNRGATITRLLPGNLSADKALSSDVAKQILTHQTKLFFGRNPRNDEVSSAQDAASQCAPKPCSAQTFARPLCYALLSSSEVLFY